MNPTEFAIIVRRSRNRSAGVNRRAFGSALLAGCAAQTPVPGLAPAPTIAPQIANAPNPAAPRQASASLKIAVSGNNHISVASPVTDTVTFSVR